MMAASARRVLPERWKRMTRAGVCSKNAHPSHPVVQMPAAYGLVSLLFNVGLFVLHAAFLLVVLLVVRKRRPDAWFWLGAGAGLRLFGTAVTSALRTFGLGLVQASDSRVMFLLAVSILELIITATWYALLIVGVLALTRDPPSERPHSF